MSDEQRLSNLLTYTTFHIGVYITLITALIGSSVFTKNSGINICLLQYASACILFAGMFGGIIGSNIPNYKTYNDMQNAKLKIYGFIPMPSLKWCIHLEHFFFWLGTLPIIVLFIFGGTDALKYTNT